MWVIQKRRKTYEIKPTIVSNSTELLLWSQWANCSWTKYLHLIDFDKKKQLTEYIPWHHIPTSAKEVQNFCESSVFRDYKSYFLKQLSKCDERRTSDVIKNMLKVFKLYKVVNNEYETSDLYCSIIHSLFEKNCNDPNLLHTVWNEICSRSNVAKAIVFCSLDSVDQKKSAKILKYILYNAQKARFDFWGVWFKGKEEEKFPFCPVSAALINGNVEQMTILLTYGFQQNSERINTYDKKFLMSSNSIYSWLMRPLREQQSKRRAILSEVLLFLIQAEGCQTDLQFVSYIKCFNLLWSYIPAPFVTKKELQDEVRRRFRKPPPELHPTITVFPSKKSHFLKLCEMYDWIAPVQVTEVAQPRALQHLSKCAVRLALVEAWHLPEGIETLPIPKLLKIYLRVCA